MKNIIRNFAVFEGVDGSGTSTQLAMLEKRLGGLQQVAGRAYPHFHITFEPTEGQVGRLIRRALKKEISLHPHTLARLFAADRTEHLYGQGGVVEQCGRGELVVSDRYVLSSLVYQGIDCGDELAQSLNCAFPLPELLVFFDIDPEISMSRVHSRSTPELYEYLEFQQKVRLKYLSLLDVLKQNGVRVETIDASKSPDEVARDVWSVLSKMPILN